MAGRRILDNLPIAIVRLREDNGQPFKTYERGFPVGRTDVRALPVLSYPCTLLLQLRSNGPALLQESGKIFLHNHLRFTILYHRDAETDLSRIVGFEVEPFSVKHKYDGKWNPATPVLKTCNANSMKYVSEKDPKQEVKEGEEIIFTYDVSFKVCAGAMRLSRVVVIQRFPLCGNCMGARMLRSSRFMAAAKRHPVGLALGHLPADDGRPDPLVQHHQLPDDRAVPFRHGGHDHDAHAAP